MAHEVAPSKADVIRTKNEAIPQTQRRMRDSVFRVLGTGVDIGVDTFQFGAEAAGHVIGKGAIHSVIRFIQNMARGTIGKPFRRAA